MNCEIISVGTELLLGDIVDTNAYNISRRLKALGMNVFYRTTVGDNEKRLLDVIDKAFKRSDIVITTGGLGATTDDITKDVVAKYFEKKLFLDKSSLDKIHNFFNKKNISMTKNNEKQAYTIEDAVILKNEAGLAIGNILSENEKTIIILPGPPSECLPMFDNFVVPFLEKFSGKTMVSKFMRFADIGESEMGEIVSDLTENSENPTVAPYAKETECILRITAKADTEEDAEKMILPIIEEIKKRLGNKYYGEGENNSLAFVVSEMLIQKGLTISVSESCTGGLLSSAFIDYPGISEVFIDGNVTYSCFAKKKYLGVKEETLDIYGAVSAETASEMAEGTALQNKTDIAISTTGVAGPDGGTLDKPVGLVYIGLYIKGNIKTKRLMLAGNREQIRKKAVYLALDFLRLELLKL